MKRRAWIFAKIPSSSSLCNAFIQAPSEVTPDPGPALCRVRRHHYRKKKLQAYDYKSAELDD